MKCPECDGSQKYKYGMVCGACGYHFTLNPKAPPNLTDMAMKKAIEGLTLSGQYYFTFNQLTARVYRLLRKKQRSSRIGCLAAMVLLGIILAIAAGANTRYWPFVIGVEAVLLLMLCVSIWRRPLTVSYEQVIKPAHEYLAAHPSDRLATGRAFVRADPDILGPDTFDPEFAAYAPERVLIVQRDELADLLILNRFHVENKTLVVSANKYPAMAFNAYRRFIAAHPQLPIQIIHDASKSGHRMKTDLANDPEWDLAGKKIDDLGVHPYDVERLKTPVWLPDSGKQSNIINHGKPVENIQSGFKMPVDTAPPKMLMAGFGLAMVTGYALLSESLFEEYQRQAVAGGFGGGGFDVDFG